MSWGLVSVAGASVVGGIMSSNQASKDRKAAQQADANQLAFEQEKYDDWKEIYGPIQENLGNYYSNLTPDYYEAQGIQAFEEERALAMENLNAELARRGIDDSGIAAGLFRDMELDAAETRAGIRVDAPRMVAEDQSRFLQIGLGQNPGDSMSRTLSQQAQAAGARRASSEAAAGQAWGDAVRTTGQAISDYTRSQPPAVDPGKAIGKAGG